MHPFLLRIMSFLPRSIEVKQCTTSTSTLLSSVDTLLYQQYRSAVDESALLHQCTLSSADVNSVLLLQQYRSTVDNTTLLY